MAPRSPTSSASRASRASTACSPRRRSSYVAQMQEAGIPVTFGYISDAHDQHGVAGEIHATRGPGEADYVQQLHNYDDAFDQFFNRLAADGITKKNTLFVFTVEEGDHFAGSHPTPAGCDGVTVPCTLQPGRRGQRQPAGPAQDPAGDHDAVHGPLRHGADALPERQPGAHVHHGACVRPGSRTPCGRRTRTPTSTRTSPRRSPTRSRRRRSTWSPPIRSGRRT